MRVIDLGGQDTHARSDRRPLPHLVLGRARAPRPRPQAPLRAVRRSTRSRTPSSILRCGYTAAASAGALHRIDVTIRDAINQGLIAGPAPGRVRAGHLRDLGHARLEPLLLAARHGRPRDLRRRRRGGSQGGPPEHPRGLRRHQALRHRRGAACDRTSRPRRRCTPTRRSRSRSTRRTSATARSPRTCAGTTASSCA